MSSNEKEIIEKYTNYNEDARATLSRADGLEFHFTKKVLDKYIYHEQSVIEIGCATGYYGMYLADKCRSYTGVDLVPAHIELFNEKIRKADIKNIKTLVGDATNLSNIQNEEYDIVLVFGPMYHLPPEERDLVFIEAKRICKNDGILLFSYVNKLGAYLQDGILSFPDIYPNPITSECILEKGINDISTEPFFFTTPEEISEVAKKHGLKILRNIGVNFWFNKELINNMDEAKFRCWLEFSEHMCESESCTGLSTHALLVCRKI